jgi:hypothetical protein
MDYLEIVPQGFTVAVESMNKITKTELLKDMVKKTHHSPRQSKLFHFSKEVDLESPLLKIQK